MCTLCSAFTSMLSAYAALLAEVPFANGAPNLAVDTPVLRQLATERNVPISGKDFKTGQTLMKTVLAPMLRAKGIERIIHILPNGASIEFDESATPSIW